MLNPLKQFRRSQTGLRPTYASSARGLQPGHSTLKLGFLLGLAAILVALVAPSLLAQDPISMNTQGDFVLNGDYSGSAFTPPQPSEDIGVGGMGINGRVGHQTGPTVGQPNSLTYVDINPYMFFEDTYLFGDGRLYIANNGNMGGSAGLGIRQFFRDYNSIIGAGFYYDRDNTRGVNFEQLGLSTELFTEWLDVRGNLYFPFGPTEKILGVNLVPGSEAFVDAPGGVGSNITFQRRTKLAQALQGFDVMFTVPVPGEIAQKFNVEATAGFYNYVTEGAADDIWGYELRADADFFKKFAHLFVQFTSDKVFDNKLIVGADVNYWHDLQDRPRLGKSQFNRIAQYVRRNRTVVASEGSFLNAPELAINPLTSNPYLVLHVRNLLDATETAVLPPPSTFPAPAGNGSLGTPFQFINEAQAAGIADIIYVHADSIYDGDITGATNVITLNPGELILGEGVQQTIPVEGLSQRIVLPRATNGTNRPILRDVAGTAVTMASTSTFAGFDIQNVTGDGIFVGAVNNALVRDVRINTTTGNGVTLNGTNGAITFTDVSVTNAGLAGLSITNSSPTLLFSGSITDSVGPSLFVFDSAGSINLTGTTITSTGGGGIVIGGAGVTTSSVISLGDITLTNTPGAAIAINNYSGGLSVPGNIVINNPTGDGIQIDTLAANRNISFQGTIDINNRNATGINLTNNAGNILLLGGVNIASLGGGAAPAVNFQGNTGEALFGNLTINGSNGTGIAIGGTTANTGAFRVNGQTTITNTVGDSIAVLSDAARVQFNGVNIDNRTARGIFIDDFSGIGLFDGFTIIDNNTNSTQSALVVQNSTGDVAFTNANIIDALGGAGNPGVLIANNVAPDPEVSTISFGSLAVTSNNTTGVSMVNNQNVSVATGVLATTNGRAIEVIDNVDFNLQFQAISASDSDFGIFVQDRLDPDTAGDDTGNVTTIDTRRFVVTGANGIVGSGGTISNMTVAGARFDLREIDTDGFVNEKSGFISIGPQFYTGNLAGIQMEAVDQAELLLTTVRDSISIGVDLLNVRQFRTVGSQYINNGLGPAIQQEQFRARMGTVDNYVYDFNANVFSDQGTNVIVGDDMILLDTIAGGTGSTLNLLFRNHGVLGLTPGIVSNRAGAAALSVQWDGPLAATVEDNNFNLLQGVGQIGTEFITGQVGVLTDVVYRRNTLTAAGAFATGFRGDFAGPTALEISNNFGRDNLGNANIPGFQFSGSNSIGLDMSFRAPTNNVFINDNFIRFNSFDSVGIQFTTINGPSSVNISGNTINLFNDLFLPVERGIFFQTVIGTVALSGARDNIVTFGSAIETVPFFIPAGTSIGSILVNGSQVP